MASHRPLLPSSAQLGLVATVGLLSFALLGAPSERTGTPDQIDAPIQVATLDVFNADYTTVARVLETQSNDLLSRPVSLVVEGNRVSVSPEQLGFSLDSFKTMETVYDREVDLLTSPLSTNLLGTYEPEVVPLTFDMNFETFQQQFVTLFPSLQDRSMVSVVIAGMTLEVNLLEADDIGEPSLETLYPSSPDELHWSEIAIPEPFTFHYDDGTGDKTYVMRATKDWLDLTQPSEDGVYRTIDEANVRDYLERNVAAEIDIASQDAVLTALPAEGSDYATVEGIAHDGRAVNVEATLEAYRAAQMQGLQDTTLVVETVTGKILNQTGTDLGALELLAQGHSNFATSPEGRDFNVRKGLNEKVNSILLAPGAEYSFNKNLGPVTNSAGWKNSLAIFGGTDLRSVPGGGLCQVSTTVYRAALQAGLPIVEQYNHSLYVHYYTAGGDGLDSTIFPGVKDLRFTNDTGHYLLLQAYDDGYDAYVNVYGTSDGRSSELFGPFLDSSIPAEYADTLSLSYNQIGWVRVIRDASGNLISEENRISTYRSIPY